MNFTGRLTGISRDFETSKPVLQLAVNESLYGIDDLKDKDLSIKIVRKTRKRSLDANALMWHCIGEIAKSLNPPRDKWEIYLESLRKYGKYTYVLLSD